MSQIFLWLLKLFGGKSSGSVIVMAETLLAEAAEAWLTNLAAVGVQDGARFIADARALSAQIDAKDASGSEKLGLFVDAAKVLLVELGGDVAHTLTESVVRTAAELLHQTDASR